MSKKKLEAALQETAEQTDTDPSVHPIKLTKGETWRDSLLTLGKAFMGAQGGKGFVVVRDANVHVHRVAPGTFKATPRQWGAWRAWRKSNGLRIRFMDQQGYYTVPAEWPHDFDADWPEHKSHDAANRWQDRSEHREPQLPLGDLARSEGL